MTNAIEVKNLSYSYKDKRVLKSVSLGFKAGLLTAILGKNGSGKTTLLKVLAGLLPCKSGEVIVKDIDLSKMRDSERAKIIGYLPQLHHPTFAFKVRDVVLTGRASYVFTVPKAEDIEKTNEALELVGIGYLSDRVYTELSGGERQMVMMARLLAQGAEIMLLDEPLSHLDLPNQVKMCALMRGLTKRGHTVIAVLHDPTTALRIAEEVVFMKQGEVIFNGATVAGLTEEGLGELYGIEVSIIHTDKGALVVPSLR